jgi:hypothetical protein
MWAAASDADPPRCSGMTMHRRVARRGPLRSHTVRRVAGCTRSCRQTLLKPRANAGDMVCGCAAVFRAGCETADLTTSGYRDSI